MFLALLLAGFREAESEPVVGRGVLLLLDLLAQMASLLAPTEPAFAGFVPQLIRIHDDAAALFNETAPAELTPAPVELTPTAAVLTPAPAELTPARAVLTPAPAVLTPALAVLTPAPAATRTVTAFVPAVIPTSVPIRTMAATLPREEVEEREMESRWKRTDTASRPSSRWNCTDMSKLRLSTSICATENKGQPITQLPSVSHLNYVYPGTV